MESSHGKMGIKINKISKKLKNNVSAFYYFTGFFLILGLTFFLSSNRLLNKDFDIMSTELNKKIVTNSMSIELKNREFNPSNGLIKFNFKIKSQGIQQVPIKVQLIERSNLQEIIKTNLVKLSDEDYVIYANLPKKWTVVSLNIIEENEPNKSNKFYSDIRDISIDNQLAEKNKESLKVEITADEITTVGKEIDEINSEIENRNLNISALEEKIKALEQDKKYQTESEKVKTDSEIQSSKSSIESAKAEIERMNKNKVELQEKIKKLEEKKADLNKLIK